jgi:hypothetical protein
MAYIDPNAELEEIRRLGEIRDTPPLPTDYNPFSGQSPYPVDPADFTGEFPDPKSFEERLEAAFEFIPVGEEIDFEQIKNGLILED